jgi:hypothetical protein
LGPELDELVLDEPLSDFEDHAPIEMRGMSPASVIQNRSGTGISGTGVVPLPDASPNALRGLVDEVVVDRYAMLDSSAPRLLRTFDDVAVPEGWLPAKRSRIPAAPQPPASPGWSAPDVVLEEIDEVIDEEIDEIVAPEPQPVDSLDQEPIEIDDLLGTGVMDAFLEVQAAITGDTVGQERDPHWWNTRNPAISVESDVVISDPVGEFEENSHVAEVDEYDGRYDVVEPEHGARLQAGHKTPPAPPPDEEMPAAEQSAASHSQGRYVPQPKYRNIFSTLRRRIGRSM